MSRYDGLIIPRSYSEYINKTDAATLQQALQLSGVLSGAVADGDNKAVKSSAVYNALANLDKYEDIQVNFSATGVTCDLIGNAEHFLPWIKPADRYIQYVTILVPTNAKSCVISYWTQSEAIPSIIFDNDMNKFCVSVLQTTPITKGFVKVRFYK